MEIPEEIKSQFPDCPPEIVAYIYYLHEKIDKLEVRVTELESRLNLNSYNSGKPPSSDGYTHKNRTTSLRKRKPRKNQEVNPVTKEKLWNRVLILITSKLILLKFVPVVEEVFKMEQ
ncbi:DUF6444 domain-containing protein [uncultured Methanospirillum sp.]|uniref:DUF6444 domain-containing protein n=1 Tax=uncultured Methanospirillum sp. TaxID=262503 RepID=UPI0029C80271|nr:DUF6444 domain-containing protein [uncultured Methanospirillum sp.]